MLESTTFKPDVMERAAGGGFALATDIADYLVKQGMPFREAHEIVGSVVGYCAAEGKDFPDLTEAEWQRFSPVLAEGRPPLTPRDAIEARNVLGGTGDRVVQEAREAFDSRLTEIRKWIDEKARQVGALDALLADE
jgi:argininosuccinate lyase